MKAEPDNLPKDDISKIKLDLQIEESWVDNIVNQYKPEIPINEKITLSNIRVQIGNGILNILADLKDKDESSINVTVQPAWDADNQSLLINDLKLKTDTKNVFLKSAGVFAQLFLNAKMDKKLEEQANKMYNKQIEKLKSKSIKIPVPKGGTAEVLISSIIIHDLEFLDQVIRVKATINGILDVKLSGKS